MDLWTFSMKSGGGGGAGAGQSPVVHSSHNVLRNAAAGCCGSCQSYRPRLGRIFYRPPPIDEAEDRTELTLRRPREGLDRLACRS